MVIVVEPVVQLPRTGGAVFAAGIDISFPFFQQEAHLVDVVHAAQLVGVINVDGVLQKGTCTVGIGGQGFFKTACGLLSVQLVVIDEGLDKLGSGETVAVVAEGCIVVYGLCHLDGFVLLSAERIFLAQQHPGVVVVSPQFVLLAECQFGRNGFYQRVVDIVVIVMRQHGKTLAC